MINAILSHFTHWYYTFYILSYFKTVVVYIAKQKMHQCSSFLSYRAKVNRRSAPPLLKVLFILCHLPTQHQLAPPPLLLAARLLFDSLARPRPSSAPLCSLPPPLPQGDGTLLAGWPVHSAPSPPCQATVRCTLWTSSSQWRLALQIPTARWAQCHLKVRDVHTTNQIHQ